MFGSFYRGWYVLHELLRGPLASRVEVVGVATDDPSQRYVTPQRRVWQYPHAPAEETMVRELAASHGLDVYTGRIRSDAFHEILERRWRPELCIMATFGQRIGERVFSHPRLGFYNLHPCTDDGWPSRFAGGNPFQAMQDCGTPHAVIAMHRVDEGFDTGELIAYSEPIGIPPHATVTDLHKITSPTAARLAATQIARILDGAGA